MRSYFESTAKAQSASLEAVAGFADAYLNAVERMAQLCIETSRAACEQSTEMAIFCLEETLAHQNVDLWNSTFQSGIERFLPALPQNH